MDCGKESKADEIRLDAEPVSMISVLSMLQSHDDADSVRLGWEVGSGLRARRRWDEPVSSVFETTRRKLQRHLCRRRKTDIHHH